MQRKFQMKHAYLGTSFNEIQILDCLKNNQEKLKIKNVIYKVSNNNELSKIVAKDISEGKVIGWFQGKWNGDLEL